MEIKTLKKFVTDQIELISIALPSSALVVIIFAYKKQIYPALQELPDPLAGNKYGILLFLVVTLIVFLTIKRMSNDVLDWLYDKFYRDFMRKDADTWYKRAQKEGLLTSDPLLSKYKEALTTLKKSKNPVVGQVDALQIQSKLARSISIMFFLFAICMGVVAVMGAKYYFLLTVGCLLVSFLMLYGFFKERWNATELVYEAILRQKGL